jgi:hypothetical protein
VGVHTYDLPQDEHIAIGREPAHRLAGWSQSSRIEHSPRNRIGGDTSRWSLDQSVRRASVAAGKAPINARHVRTSATPRSNPDRGPCIADVLPLTEGIYALPAGTPDTLVFEYDEPTIETARMVGRSRDLPPQCA